MVSPLAENDAAGVKGDADHEHDKDDEANDQAGDDTDGSLLHHAEAANGLSGHSLQRIPLQSHAKYIQSSEQVSMECFLEALKKGIVAEQGPREQFNLEG